MTGIPARREVTDSSWVGDSTTSLRTRGVMPPDQHLASPPVVPVPQPDELPAHALQPAAPPPEGGRGEVRQGQALAARSLQLGVQQQAQLGVNSLAQG